MEDKMDHRSRAKLIDVPERRSVLGARDFEFRKDKASGQYVLEGYASTWDPYDCYGGVEAGGWVEQIDRASMKRTLSENPDLMFLVNHEGLPLARTTTDTLKLNTDGHGLFMRAFMDPEDPDVQRIAPKLKPQANGRSNMDEMSFAFRVKDQQWDNNYSHRTITELSLQKGDVSLVNYGMNPNTHIQVMDAIGQLAQLSDKELVEVRGRMDHNVLLRAAHVLQRASGEVRGSAFGGAGFVNFDGSHLLYEGNCVTCAGARARGTQDNIPYADPGFIDSVKRLPVDELHVKASWQFFNQPKNQQGYTSEQVAQIRGSIQTAMTMHGLDADEEKGMAEQVEIDRIEQVRSQNGGITLVAVMTDGTRTPLPSFRQSGELVGAGAGDGGNPFGSRAAGDDQGGDGAKGPNDDVDDRGQVPPQFKPKGKGKNPEDDPAQGGDGGKDDDQEDPSGKKKPEKKSDDDMSEDGLRADTGHGADCNCPMCTQMDERDDNTDEPDEDDAPPDNRSASERLAELRKSAELPDRPSVTDAMEYLRQLA